MSFPAPLSVSPIGSTDTPASALRLNQRITAQVLSVTGTTVVLEIEGSPVVAQLTEAEQAATLAARQMAQFIVRDVKQGSITLQLAKQSSAQPVLLGSPPSEGELAERLLQNTGLPVTTVQIMLARSLLKQNLPITAELLHELNTALTEYGHWTQTEADLSAALKAAALPVTGESLALSSFGLAQTNQAYTQLWQTLNTPAMQSLPQDLQTQVTTLQNMLQDLFIMLSNDSSRMAHQLKTWVQTFGTSFENALAHEAALPAFPALVLKLARQLQQVEKKDQAEDLHQFLRELRYEHFMNSAPEHEPAQGRWLELNLGVASPKSAFQFLTARLRIAHESPQNTSRINPAYTRLVLQVEIQPDEIIEVDLSLAGQAVRAEFRTANPTWLQNAKAELPSFSSALQELGYHLKNFQAQSATPLKFQRIKPKKDSLQISPPTIDLEV